jgi:hypothetical protein
VAGASDRDQGQTFSTWEDFEVDKCASIWLIKRFIDKEAKIAFFAKGTRIGEGIPFDVPEATLRRYHNLSTFECLLRSYSIRDPKLHYIARIVHDAEINTWERKAFEETPVVQLAVLQIIEESKGADEIVARSCRYFDGLYETMGLSAKPSHPPGPGD